MLAIEEMMMSEPAPSVEFINPPNKLKMKLGNKFSSLNPDRIAAAEAALQAMSSQFGEWLNDEVKRLEQCHAAARAANGAEAERESLYRAAHDLKGLGTTYGYPIVSEFGDSLCRLIDSPEGRQRAPHSLLDAHVESIKAAVRQKITDNTHPVGAALLGELKNQVRQYAPDET
jgi:chemotaxis protein histidine kinase CheA